MILFHSNCHHLIEMLAMLIKIIYLQMLNHPTCDARQY